MIITNNSALPSLPSSNNIRSKQSLQSLPSNKSVQLQSTNIILNIFHYTWFVDRVQEENDLFRS